MPKRRSSPSSRPTRARFRVWGPFLLLGTIPVVVILSFFYQSRAQSQLTRSTVESRAHSVAFGFSLGVGSKVGDITDPQLQTELRTRLSDALQTDQGILAIDVLAPTKC